MKFHDVCFSRFSSGSMEERKHCLAAAKKERITTIARRVLAGIVLLGLTASMVACRKPNDTTDPVEATTAAQTGGYSEADEEQIAAIVTQADAFAAKGNYESALAAIQVGLLTYPNSKVLQSKQQSYSSALIEQSATTTEPATQIPTEAPTQAPGEIPTVKPAGSPKPEDNTPKPVSQKSIASVTSSSYLIQKSNGTVHSADRIVDGKLSTAWVEGVDGFGFGEWVRIDLKEECVISGFTIHAGYHKSEELWNKNSRPCEIAVELSDGSYVYCNLDDSFEPQTIQFKFPITASAIAFTIEDVYVGDAYDDTVISEIELF